MGFLRNLENNKRKPVVAKLRLREPDPLPLAEMLRQPDLKIRGVRIPLALRRELLSVLGSKPDQEQQDLITKYLNQCIDDYLLVERYRNALETHELYWPTTKPSDEEG